MRQSRAERSEPNKTTEPLLEGRHAELWAGPSSRLIACINEPASNGGAFNLDEVRELLGDLAGILARTEQEARAR